MKEWDSTPRRVKAKMIEVVELLINLYHDIDPSIGEQWGSYKQVDRFLER
jgi:hypothetical protein